ncbi:MAG: hypothetical protein KUG77_24190, partial [Nannocystaceae bacterium]|nr:hypothetical protein [Nannocystaceae bacterium]
GSTEPVSDAASVPLALGEELLSQPPDRHSDTKAIDTAIFRFIGHISPAQRSEATGSSRDPCDRTQARGLAIKHGLNPLGKPF